MDAKRLIGSLLRRDPRLIGNLIPRLGTLPPIQGEASVTLGGVTAAAAGQVKIKGAESTTLEGVSPSAAGVVDGFAAIRSGGGAALMVAMGLSGEQTPAGLWLLESATSNADLSGSGFTLTNDGTTPTLVTDALVGGSVVQFDDLTSDRMKASANTVLQITTGSFAFLWVGRVITDTGNTRALGGKHTGSAGYEFRVIGATGSIQCNVADGVTSVQNNSTVTTYEDGNAFVAALGMDQGRTNEVFLVSDRETRKEADKVLVGSLTNASVFGIGQTSNSQAVGMNCHLVAFWTTLPATTLSQTHMSNLKSFLRV